MSRYVKEAKTMAWEHEGWEHRGYKIQIDRQGFLSAKVGTLELRANSLPEIEILIERLSAGEYDRVLSELEKDYNLKANLELCPPKN